MNKFSNREEFFDSYDKIQLEISTLLHNISQNEKVELYRIKKEFLFREYGKRYNVTLENLLSTIFGYELALQELSNTSN